LYRIIVFTLGLAAAGLAQTPRPAAPKIALINIQDAILATTDGQNANSELDAQFAPKKAKLDADRKVVEDLQARLEHETMSAEARDKLTREVNDKIVLLNVETDQDDADLDKAQKEILARLGKKMVEVIIGYSTSHGYAMVFDVSTSMAPLLYAENATDITSEVAKAYESKYKK
jgi:Skp family chaperone for outer membrane proteins